MGALTVTFEDYGIAAPAEAGETILEVATRAGVGIATYCGGHGICCQCQVVVTAGQVQPKHEAHWQQWPTPDGKGIRVLACQSVVTEDITVKVPIGSRAEDFVVHQMAPLKANLVDLSRFEPLSPLAQQFVLDLPKPTLEDSVTDMDRLRRELLHRETKLEPITIDLPVLRELPQALRENDFQVAVAVSDIGLARKISAIRPPAAADSSLGLAIDVGTSTVAVQLVDLDNGQVIGRAIRRNGQIAYGEDVISRIVWTQKSPEQLQNMHRAIIDTLNQLFSYLYNEYNATPDEVIAASVAGNATMINFLLRIDASPIRRSPHTPPATEIPVFTAEQLGLNIHPQGAVCVCHPAVSGFVGGDITAGVVATGMHEAEELALLVDVGTNGEIVAGNKDWLICASCSAGPAFEGVGVEAAMPATAGAVTNFDYNRDRDAVDYQTIGNQPPRGIAGSGLVEMIASLVKAEVIDRTGNINADFPSGRLQRSDDELGFVLFNADETAIGEPIIIYQHDIENLLRSKAAVLAAINVLLGKLALTPADIEHVYLAGAFGAGLNVDKAVAIGLLPDIARERIEVVGDTALAGAYLTLMSRQARDQARATVKAMTYLDLSSDTDFMDEFIASNFIPHTDLTRFPSVST